MLLLQSNCCAKAGTWHGTADRHTALAYICMQPSHAVCKPITPTTEVSQPWLRVHAGYMTVDQRGPSAPVQAVTSTSMYTLGTQGACEFRQGSNDRSHQPRCTNSTCTTQIVQFAASIAKQLRDVILNVERLYWLRCSLTTCANPTLRPCTMQQSRVLMQECASASCFVNQHCSSSRRKHIAWCGRPQCSNARIIILTWLATSAHMGRAVST